MTDDLVKRLRDWKGIRMSPEKMAHFIAVAQEAADALERLSQQAEPVAFKDTCVTTMDGGYVDSSPMLLGYAGWQSLPDGTELYAAPPATQPAQEPVLLNLAFRLRMARSGLRKAIANKNDAKHIEFLRGVENEAWNSFQAAKTIAAPPADDEAVQLLTEAHKHMRWHGICEGLRKMIDAYLAKGKK